MATIGEAVLLAFDLQAAGRLAEAEELYRRILAADPLQADARRLLGVLWGQAGRLEHGAALLAAAIALRPDIGDYYLNFAQLRRAIGDAAAADRAQRRALALGCAAAADAATLNAMADRCHDSGDMAGAATLYRAVVALSPGTHQPWYNLGTALVETGRMVAAASAFAAAAALVPAYLPGRDYLAVALFHAGQPAAAAALATEILNLKDQAARAIAAAAPPLRLTAAAAAGEGEGRRRRRIIAFSLWGDGPAYVRGAVENARLTPRFYPGWTCRVYHDDSVPAAALAELAAAGAELAAMPAGSGPAEGLFWRFFVADDPEAAVFLCRDADSRLNSREAAAVADWLASGLPFHVMRDHALHSELMLAGMWGGRAGLLPPLAPLARAFAAAASGRLKDQQFLARHVWPLIADHCLVHDSAHPGCGQPFPAVAIDGDFAFTHVGAGVKLG